MSRVASWFEMTAGVLAVQANIQGREGRGQKGTCQLFTFLLRIFTSIPISQYLLASYWSSLTIRKFVKYHLSSHIGSWNKIGDVELRKPGKINVGKAMNRLCHTSLNIKGHVLAAVREKLKEKWSDFRHGCIQVLNLCHQEPLSLFLGPAFLHRDFITRP